MKFLIHFFRLVVCILIIVSCSYTPPKSYNFENFNKDVVEASNATPVLIDFWAPWCGPCRELSPVLEKLATESDGQWKLVKINIEKHPNIYELYNPRGLPAVLMVYREKIIAGFYQAQPKPWVREWLDKNLPQQQI